MRITAFLFVLSLLCTAVLAQAPINWFRDGTINWEAEKQQRQIKTTDIVIHHTAMPPGVTWQQLSEIQKERIYAPRFKPTIPDPFIPEGTPIQSGHFRYTNNKPVEVFYVYHWLVRDDGSAFRLLNDEEVGWHSGSWEENNHSIAICLDGDFSRVGPSGLALETCALLIRAYVSKYGVSKILGHCDVKQTECPGAWFRQGGKAKLLQMSGLKQ